MRHSSTASAHAGVNTCACVMRPERQWARIQRRAGSDAVHALAAGCMQVWDGTPGLGEETLEEAIWASIDEAIVLADSDVYRQGRGRGEGRGEGDKVGTGAARWEGEGCSP